MNNEKYYATLTTPTGEIVELGVSNDGFLNCTNEDLEGYIETNAKIIDCSDNRINAILATDAELIDCSFNQLVSIYAPKSEQIICAMNDGLEYFTKPDNCELYWS